MSKLNTVPDRPSTHEGAPAKRISPMAALRRSVCSALLWEKEFYEDGDAIADRILTLSEKVPLPDLAALALEVRTSHNLRHVPLLLLVAMARQGSGRSIVRHAIADTIRRVDEMGELLAIYAKVEGRGTDEIKPILPAQVKKGLAAAFCQFDAYQLGKYNRKGAFSLKDLILLTHPRPANSKQAELWKAVLDGTLKAPDTWEVGLSGGADKRETFTRLITEGRLGYLALLRNLRGMVEAGVDLDLIRTAIKARKGADKVLPFRFVAAARACPQLEPEIDKALVASIQEGAQLPGKTLVLADVSGSMTDRLSEKSDLTRLDAAACLASMVNADGIRVFTFSNALVEIPARRGMAAWTRSRTLSPTTVRTLGTQSPQSTGYLTTG